MGDGRPCCQHCCQSWQDLSEHLANRRREMADTTVMPALLPVLARFVLKFRRHGRLEIKDTDASTVASPGKICLKN